MIDLDTRSHPESEDNCTVRVGSTCARFSTLADRRTRSRRLAATAHFHLQRRLRQLVSENQAKRAS